MNTLKKLVKKILLNFSDRGRLLLLLLLSALTFTARLTYVGAADNPFVSPINPANLVTDYLPGLISNITFTVIGKVVFFFAFIISYILGLGIAIEAWLVGAILNINTNLVNSAPVKFGFPVSLSIVNLGFVLGIIVIAIATILRYEQYGIKKILMKLVAAAILVNFSLVIASVILNFSDQLTGYFLESVNPVRSASFTKGFENSGNFASALAGAFNPQRAFLLTDSNGNFTLNPLNATGTTALNSNADALQKLAGAFGGDIGKMMVPIFSIAFAVFSLILMAITLFALIVMLIIRYVYIGILLVVMPFAWLLWVFPNFQSQWNKWWHNFLRWTFFSPIVVFFLWLAIQTSAEISKGAQGYNFAQYVANNSSNQIWQVISNILTNIFSPLVENFLQMAIVLGLMLGGLFAANSFGITFASTALGATKGLGKGLGKWVGSKTLEYAGAPLRKKKKYGGLGSPIKEMSRAERFQERVGKIKNPVLRYGASWAARGVTGVSTLSGEKQVDRYSKMVSNMKTADLHAMAPTVFGAKLAAVVNEIGKRSTLEQIKNTDLSHGGKTKKLFTDLGMAEDYEKNIEKKSFSSEAWEAMKAGASQQEINNIMAKDAKKWGRGDPAHMQLNDLHSGTAGKFGLTEDAIKKMAKANAYAFAAAAPHLVSSALTQMKTQSLKNFAGGRDGGGDYREGLTRAEQARAITAPEWIERQDQFRRIIVNNVFYAGTGGTYPPQPPPPGGTPP